jgi:hypothetical protein
MTFSNFDIQINVANYFNLYCHNIYTNINI